MTYALCRFTFYLLTYLLIYMGFPWESHSGGISQPDAHLQSEVFAFVTRRRAVQSQVFVELRVDGHVTAPMHVEVVFAQTGNDDERRRQ